MLVAGMAIAIIALAAWSGLRILKKEYLPLLKELERSRQELEKAEQIPEEEGGSE